MRVGFSVLAALALAAHGILSPFRILCRAPGPDGHERIEFAFAGCCAGHEACAEDASCCGPCVDQPVQQDQAVRALPHPAIADCTPAIASIGFLPPVADPPPGDRALPDHPGDPPLFLTLRNFRI